MSPLQLLDAARMRCTPPTWYQLAKRLDTTQSALATWRARGGTYDDEAACELSKILGKSLEEVLAIREAQHAKHEKKRKRWRLRLRHLALLLGASWIGFGESPDLRADVLPTSQQPNSSQYSTPSEKTKKATNREESANVFTLLQIMRHSRRLLTILRGLWQRTPALCL